MKAVYPVTLKNAALYEPLADLFAKIGPQREHDLYIVTCPAALEAAQTFAEAIKRLFRSVEIGTVTNIVENTPSSRNAMFRDAVYLLEKDGNASPWIWMENAYPVDRDWLQMVQEEWNAKPLDRHFLGCIENAYLPAMKDGERVTGPNGQELYHPAKPYMRFGVYPANFSHYSAILTGLGRMPFEIEMAAEIAPRCHPSRTVKTLWASVNYEKTRRGFEGDRHLKFEQEIRKNEPTSISTEGVAILHGCRDRSILLPLLGQHWHSTGANASRKGKAPSGKGESSRVAELEAEIAELKAQLSGVREEAPTLSEEQMQRSMEDHRASMKRIKEAAAEEAAFIAARLERGKRLLAPTPAPPEEDSDLSTEAQGDDTQPIEPPSPDKDRDASETPPETQPPAGDLVVEPAPEPTPEEPKSEPAPAAPPKKKRGRPRKLAQV